MIKSFKVGDVLSESSHYKVLADNGNLNFKLKHLESGDVVYIDDMITLGKKRKSHLKSMRLEGVRVHVCVLLLQKECLRRE